jgi:ribose 5-phosphate isomerase B
MPYTIKLMEKGKTIAMGADHRGFKLKETLKDLLTSKGYEVHDFGTNSTESCDYPDFGAPAARSVAAGQAFQGIIMCATGNGMAMSANKVHGIRAALCVIPEMARLARAHNDANVLVLPADFVSDHIAREIVETWLETPFEGGRHERRVLKIEKIENGRG